MASFLVRREPVVRLLDGTGIEPSKLPGGRTMCIIAAVQYIDNDLGPYDEVAMCFPMSKGDAQQSGAFIHQLPVNGAFTLAAGRGIWGFPKWMADIDLTFGPKGMHCRLSEDGRLVLDLTVKPRRLPVPSKPLETSAYAHIDGVTRRTAFTSRATGVKGGPFGARLEVGTDHPMALELRSLGLPKRPAMSSIIGNMAATFGEATQIANR